MSDYKETFIGPIPIDWDLIKLSKLATKITDGTHKTPTYTESGIHFLRVTDIKSGNVDWNKTKFVSKKEHDEMCKRCNPEVGDILYSKNGTIGVPKVVDWDKEFSIFVSLCLIKPIHDLVDNKYLEQYLYSSSCKRQIDRRAKQGTVTNLHLEEIRELDIPLPCKSEQKKIAKILSTVDGHIDEVDGMIADLKELKKGLMQKLLTEGIGHTEFKDSAVGWIPVDWEVSKLGEKSMKITKGTTPTTIGHKFVDEGINFIKVESLTQTGGFEVDKFMNITMECHEEMSRSQIRDGDLLVSIAGTIGRSAVINNEYLPANTNQALAIVRVNTNKLIAGYLHYLFSSSYLKKYIRKVSTVGAQPNMSLDQISKFMIPIPDINEQKLIVKHLNDLEDKLQLTIDKRNNFIELKKGLMQQLLTGKKRVKIEN